MYRQALNEVETYRQQLKYKAKEMEEKEKFFADKKFFNSIADSKSNIN